MNYNKISNKLLLLIQMPFVSLLIPVFQCNTNDESIIVINTTGIALLQGNRPKARGY